MNEYENEAEGWDEDAETEKMWEELWGGDQEEAREILEGE